MTVVAVLLTFGSGAMDVATFTRLGNVFASVMTGNIVVFGLSLARGSVSLAAHTAMAFAGYVLGVAIGTRVAWFHSRRVAPDSEDSPWPPHVTWAFLLELALLAGFTIGWEVSGGSPSGGTQFAVLGIAACAMGIQSAAVIDMGLKEVSTTFLTGTLTGLVSALASGDGQRVGVRRPGVLLGLAGGAILAGLLVAYLPSLVPVLPLGALAAVLVLGYRSVPAAPHKSVASGTPESRESAPDKSA
jgi:uncharacterized membrane protein YoaK (UPF0700 family)